MASLLVAASLAFSPPTKFSAPSLTAPHALRAPSARLALRPLPLPSPTAAAAGLAFLPTLAARADFSEDLWYELNRAPIELNPFTIRPVGIAFFVLYAAYLSWSLFKPPTEGEMRVAAEADADAAAAAALAPAFLAQATDEEGAIVTDSGLIYLEIAAGSGEAPERSQKVVVDYTGTLADGTVFDSSVERGKPAEFKVSQVIAGWQEGLQLMKPGGKARLTMPASLGYGSIPVGQIPGDSALSFEVELLEVKEGGFGLF